MAGRAFGDYGIDPLSLSVEENEQVAELVDENNALLYEVPVLLDLWHITMVCHLNPLSRW